MILYSKFKNECIGSENKNKTEWTFELPPSAFERGLLVLDLMFSKPSDIHLKTDASRHDRILLSISTEAESEALATAFRKSKIYGYLNSLLERHADVNFGKLTASLHNDLLDKPAPYRKDLKKLVENLFSWVEDLCPEIAIVQHRHTRSFRKK